jgi:anti-repressor protein
MNELIKIHTNENGQAVSARDLHNALGMQKDFSDWFKYQANKLGLIEGLDFTPILGSKTEGSGGHNKIDYIMSIDTAKHIAMMSGGENAHKIREYFIQVEKAWNSPEMVMARSLQFAAKQIDGYKEKLQIAERVIEQQKPQVLFAESVTASSTSILVADMSKILKGNGIEIGELRLWNWLRSNGYVIKEKGRSRNMPTQRSMNLKVMEVKEGTYVNSKGVSKITKTTLITGKGQVYFVNKFLKAKEESICQSQ